MKTYKEFITELNKFEAAMKAGKLGLKSLKRAFASPQGGTFKYRNNAEKQIKLIKSKYPVSTKDKISNVVLIKVSGKQLYESRFENFSKKEAYTACKRLKKYNRDCFVRL